LGKIFTPTRLG